MDPTKCSFVNFIKHFLILNILQLVCAKSGIKFIIVYVYKSMPIIDDNFFALWIFILVNVLSFLATLTKLLFLNRPTIFEVSIVAEFLS